MGEQPPDQPYLVEGYSQSASIAVLEKMLLDQTGQHPDVTFLLLGDANRPDGGIAERFTGFVIPGIASNLNGGDPTDAGIPTIDIANQYDVFADFPQFPINPVADLNAALGIVYAHAAYGDGPLPYPIPALWPPSEPLSGPYASEYVLGSTEIVKQVDGDTTFYFVPTTELPLLDPLRSLGVPEPVLNIFQPALQVIVEAGYDRSIPFGDPTPAELIPTIDPATFTLEFANGVVQGANNALGTLRRPTTRLHPDRKRFRGGRSLVGDEHRRALRPDRDHAQQRLQPVHRIHRPRGAPGSRPRQPCLRRLASNN